MRKYRSPGNDPRLLSRTLASVQQEFYEDAWEEKADLERALETPEKNQGHLRERLGMLTRMLEGAPVDPEDELIDQWERDIAEGRTPDLDMVPSKVRKR